MLSLNDLEIYLTVAEYGSFSEAGRRLHLSQPAISQTIQKLEKQLGLKLFERQGKSIRLSDAGQVLRPMALELLASARRMVETMASLHVELIGEMDIGCSTASGKYLLPGIIARFRQHFPQVRINVVIGSHDVVISRLIAGILPLGVTSKRIEHHDLEYQELLNDDVILIAPADHPWSRYRTIYPDNLLDVPMILREEDSGTREVLMPSLLAHDITPDMLTVAMVLGTPEAIEMAVEEGIGVGFVSRLAAQRGLQLGKVIEVEVKGLRLARKIYLARNRRDTPGRAQAELWSFVAEPPNS